MDYSAIKRDATDLDILNGRLREPLVVALSRLRAVRMSHFVGVLSKKPVNRLFLVHRFIKATSASATHRTSSRLSTIVYGTASHWHVYDFRRDNEPSRVVGKEKWTMRGISVDRQLQGQDDWTLLAASAWKPVRDSGSG